MDLKLCMHRKQDVKCGKNRWAVAFEGHMDLHYVEYVEEGCQY